MKGFVLLIWIGLAVQPAIAVERFACNLSALTPAERARHQENTRVLLAAVVEKAELANGYGFRLNAKELPLAAEWTGFESKCCPFFAFELALARDQGPLWLRITGSKGGKAFIRAEFGL